MVDLNNFINLAAIAAVEEAELAHAVNPRQFHIRNDAFQLSDMAFERLFRLPKQLVNDLIHRLEPYMILQSRSSALDVSTKVCIPI